MTPALQELKHAVDTTSLKTATMLIRTRRTLTNLRRQQKRLRGLSCSPWLDRGFAVLAENDQDAAAIRDDMKRLKMEVTSYYHGLVGITNAEQVLLRLIYSGDVDKASRFAADYRDMWVLLTEAGAGSED